MKAKNVYRRNGFYARNLACALVQQWLTQYAVISLICINLCTIVSWSDEGDFELLRAVMAARNANMQRLTTWQGQATVVSESAFASGDLQSYTRRDVGFAYDAASGRARWSGTVSVRQYRSSDSDVLVTHDSELHGGIVTADRFFLFAPGEITQEGLRKNTVVISTREERPLECFSTDFHPVWYCTYLGHDVDRELAYHYENRGRFINDTIVDRVLRIEDVVVWEKQADQTVNRYEFDLSKGGALIQYFAEDAAKHSDVMEWEIEHMAGVWLPSSVTYTNSTPYSDGTVRPNSYRVDFINSRVNEPLDDNEFTLRHLGVPLGTRISDHILGLTYRYDESDVLKNEDFVSAVNGDDLGGLALTKAAPEPFRTDSDRALTEQGRRGPVEVNRIVLVLTTAFGAAILMAFLFLRRRVKARWLQLPPKA